MVVRASLFRAIRIRFCQPPVERCSLFPSVFAACWWNAVEKRTRSEEKSKPKKILGSFLCPLAVGLQRRGCLTYFQHVFHFPRPITAIYPSPISCPPREFVFFSDDFNGLFFDIALPSLLVDGSLIILVSLFGPVVSFLLKNATLIAESSILAGVVLLTKGHPITGLHCS